MVQDINYLEDLVTLMKRFLAHAIDLENSSMLVLVYESYMLFFRLSAIQKSSSDKSKLCKG